MHLTDHHLTEIIHCYKLSHLGDMYQLASGPSLEDLVQALFERPQVVENFRTRTKHIKAEEIFGNWVDCDQLLLVTAIYGILPAEAYAEEFGDENLALVVGQGKFTECNDPITFVVRYVNNEGTSELQTLSILT